VLGRECPAGDGAVGTLAAGVPVSSIHRIRQHDAFTGQVKATSGVRSCQPED
jgi:hypothetical protein